MGVAARDMTGSASSAAAINPAMTFEIVSFIVLSSPENKKGRDRHGPVRKKRPWAALVCPRPGCSVSVRRYGQTSLKKPKKLKKAKKLPASMCLYMICLLIMPCTRWRQGLSTLFFRVARRSRPARVFGLLLAHSDCLNPQSVIDIIANFGAAHEPFHLQGI
jgi:hypothetical protein